MLWCLSWHQSQRCERCRELRPVRKSAAPSRDLVFFLAATAAIDESSSVRRSSPPKSAPGEIPRGGCADLLPRKSARGERRASPIA